MCSRIKFAPIEHEDSYPLPLFGCMVILLRKLTNTMLAETVLLPCVYVYSARNRDLGRSLSRISERGATYKRFRLDEDPPFVPPMTLAVSRLTISLLSSPRCPNSSTALGDKYMATLVEGHLRRTSVMAALSRHSSECSLSTLMSAASQHVGKFPSVDLHA